MILAIIMWKILPDEKSQQDFLEYWANILNPAHKDELSGEFLSEPLTQEEAGFDCTVLGFPRAKETDYVPYFNVGLWNSVDAFHQEIIIPFVNADKHTFEYEMRERMILRPRLWRSGQFHRPFNDMLVISPNEENS